MPGLSITTAVRTGPSAATTRQNSQAFFLGSASMGPSNAAVLVTSLADFVARFGGFKSGANLHPTVETFFEEGGTQCYVGRVVGASATTGKHALMNAAVEVMRVTANGPGVFASDITVSVTHPAAGTFIVNILNNAVLVYTTGSVTTVTQAVGRINSSAIASKLVIASVVLDDGTRPIVLAATALYAVLIGTVAADEDAAGIPAALLTGLTVFLDSLGSGAVACPELESAAMIAALVQHANDFSRIAILHGVQAASQSAILASALAVQAVANAEHAAMFYPWIEVPTTVDGVSRVIPPDGYVAAKRAVAINQTGAHLPAAGLVSVARFVTGVVEDIGRANGDILDDGSVNAIRIIQNTIRIYGARSCSADTSNFRYYTAQDVVNQVVLAAAVSLEDLVFSPLDGRNTIFSAISARLIAILAPLRDAGALFQLFAADGSKVDNGFTVRCDAALNPNSQLAGGTVKAKVGMRVSSIGDKIDVEIVKSNLTTSVV